MEDTEEKRCGYYAGFLSSKLITMNSRYSKQMPVVFEGTVPLRY